jgi:hypothetical protein
VVAAKAGVRAEVETAVARAVEARVEVETCVHIHIHTRARPYKNEEWDVHFRGVWIESKDLRWLVVDVNNLCRMVNTIRTVG